MRVLACECATSTDRLVLFQLQDINDRVLLEQYQKPSRGDEHSKPSKQAPFVVRGAPWDASAPDMSSASDFPELGAANSKAPAIRWGPPVKR